MEFEDRIYGTIEIAEPVICEIIASRAFQRLKGVNQYGGVNLIYQDCYQVSRFEHSIGVWWILRCLKVNLETQVAGLLHDIGHTAFSHMVDQAIGGSAEDFHENHLHLIPGWDELQAILSRHRLVLQPLEQYPEIKTSMPQIGADRMDYAIRDFVGATSSRSDIGKRSLQDICLCDRLIHFTSIETAREFALTGLQGLYEVIYAPRVAVVYQALSEMLRQGLEAGWLTPQILYGSDRDVFEVLCAHRAQFSDNHLRLFEEPFSAHPVSQGGASIFRVTKGKIRYFDPPIYDGSRSRLLSELDPAFRAELAARLELFELRRQGEFFAVEFGTAVEPVRATN